MLWKTACGNALFDRRKSTGVQRMLTFLLQTDLHHCSGHLLERFAPRTMTTKWSTSFIEMLHPKEDLHLWWTLVH